MSKITWELHFAQTAYFGHGDGEFHRAGTKSIKADSLERAVLAKLTTDLTSDAFIKSMIERAHASQHPKGLQTELATVQARIDSLTRKCAALSSLIPETTAKRSLLAKLKD